MLDRDLALLYAVETKMLKQTVKRNLSRFLKILCLNYQRTNLRIGGTNLVTPKMRKWDRVAPFAFTEQGC